LLSNIAFNFNLRRYNKKAQKHGKRGKRARVVKEDEADNPASPTVGGVMLTSVHTSVKRAWT
jgi:hypothetical protein